MPRKVEESIYNKLYRRHFQGNKVIFTSTGSAFLSNPTVKLVRIACKLLQAFAHAEVIIGSTSLVLWGIERSSPASGEAEGVCCCGHCCPRDGRWTGLACPLAICTVDADHTCSEHANHDESSKTQANLIMTVGQENIHDT